MDSRSFIKLLLESHIDFSVSHDMASNKVYVAAVASKDVINIAIKHAVSVYGAEYTTGQEQILALEFEFSI